MVTPKMQAQYKKLTEYFCHTNDVNAILKITVFLFFLTLAGLLLKTLLRIQEQP